MRPITSRTLRGIALGVLVPVVLSSTGCYQSMMQPGYGYGSPMYGNQSQSYGGYQGIQTLTPGNYYAPGTPGATYNSNGILQPTPDPNAGGSCGGGGGVNNGGGDAAPYSPPAGDNPSKLVPNDPYYDNGAGGDGSNPANDPSLQQNDSGTGNPTGMSNPAASGDWADSKVQQTSGNAESEPAAGELEPSASTEPLLDLKTVEQPEEAEEEEPPLLAPKVGE